jgi:chromosome partitioning protein
MINILVVGSRKGGVGKSSTAYELAWLLDAVLVDFEWDGGGVTRKWGYRHEDRLAAPLITALERHRTPKPLKGFRKPDLVPGSPLLLDAQPTAEDMADAVARWAKDWGREWVVIDTHPGASPAAHGAMSVANVVCVPTGLRTDDLNGTEAMVAEMPDYPLVLIPNFVPRVPPAAEITRLARIIDRTPVRVGPPIPFASAVGTRKKRLAITSEQPPAKALRAVATAYQAVAEYVKEYVR